MLRLFFDTIAGLSVKGAPSSIFQALAPPVQEKRRGIPFHRFRKMMSWMHTHIGICRVRRCRLGCRSACWSEFVLFGTVGWPSGKVYAFEPDDDNFEYLLRNIEMHHLTNVVPVRKALCDKTGVLRFIWTAR